MKDFSLYIHIPFCQKRCDYCDFFSTTDVAEKGVKLTESLIIEMENSSLLTKLRGRSVSSVYFGGGTHGYREQVARGLRGHWRATGQKHREARAGVSGASPDRGGVTTAIQTN